MMTLQNCLFPGLPLMCCLSLLVSPALADTALVDSVHSPVAQAAHIARTARSELIEATTVANLLEQQARAATALQKCMELNVRCGPGATLSDLSSVLPPPSAALPAPVNNRNTGPDLADSGRTDPDLTDPGRTDSSLSDPDVQGIPKALKTMMIPTPSRLPRFLGYANGMAQVEIDGSVLSTKAGDPLPGDWTITKLTPRLLVLSDSAGHVYRLSALWGTSHSSGTPSPVTGPVTGPVFPAMGM